MFVLQKDSKQYRHSQSLLKGFSLFEVVLATVILATSLAAIGTLMEVSRISVARSTFEIDALIRCESIIDEITLDAQPVSGSSEMPFEDDPSWTYSITVEQTEIETLQQISVQVTHYGEQKKRNADVKLVRLIYTPVSTDQETE
ncbi:MAG: hypothetical protein JKY95_03435 [Planctomycetaceae bacterium]|nr:hypothetical protein [Planctomycetaceae bacterium]